jgi:hypothetical protein
MRACAPAARLLGWDSHLQWAEQGCTPVSGIPELARACSTREAEQLAYRGPFQPALSWHGRRRVVGPHPFDAFCRVALLWARLRPCVIVVEELAEVTSPGKAPTAWGELLRWARKLGSTVYGITQRPAESDKTLLGSSHRIVCHALNGVRDARYMADFMPGVPVERLLALDYERCEYIERLANRTVRSGFNPIPGQKKIQTRLDRARSP